MSTLETQYKNYLNNNPGCEVTFDEWLEYHFSFLDEFNNQEMILMSKTPKQSKSENIIIDVNWLEDNIKKLENLINALPKTANKNYFEGKLDLLKELLMFKDNE